MLPIAIRDQSVINRIADEARAGNEIEIDLPVQQIKDASGNKLADFDVEEFRKHCVSPRIRRILKPTKCTDRSGSW